MKKKENTLLPDQFYSLTSSSLGGIPGQAPRTTGTDFHQPQTQQSTRLCLLLLDREAEGWMETASCSHHREDSARACGFPGTRGYSLSIKAPSERLPSALINTTCSGGRVLPKNANCSPKQNVTNVRFKFSDSQGELILVFRDQ